MSLCPHTHDNVVGTRIGTFPVIPDALKIDNEAVDKPAEIRCQHPYNNSKEENK